MTNTTGSTYVTATPVPAAQGPYTAGTGPVWYYFSSTYDGYENAGDMPIIFPVGGGQDGREEIDARNRHVAYRTRLGHAGPTDDRRHTNAALVREAFAGA